VSIVSINSANAVITKRVQSSYVSSNTESYRLLVSPGNNVWIDAQARFPFITSATAKYGMRITGVSSTQVDVEFGGDGAAAGDAWANYTSWKWKLLKHRDGRTLNTSTNGIVPVGSVIAIANTAVWSLPAAGQIKDGFALCNGQSVPAGAHPLLTGTLPDLSDERFIQGSTASGTTGGANTKTLTTTELPSHTHSINHDHGAFDTASGGAHTHTITDPGHFHSIGPLFRDSGLGDNNTPPRGSNSPIQGFTNTDSKTTGISINSTNSAHVHSIDVPNFTGTSGSTGSGTAFDIRPKYFNVVYVMRVL
jgi:hypothetical protein